MELTKCVIDEIPQEIYKVLYELGAPVHMIGSDYVAYASMLYLQSPMKYHSVCRVIYPEIAKAFSTTSTRVERSIRTVVEWIFENTDADVVYKYFGNSIALNKGKATNSQFICTVARIARRDILRAQCV